MDFDSSDYVIALALWLPVVGWSAVYSIGVLRWRWRKDSWKVIVTTTLLGSVAASAFVAVLAQTWRAAAITAPVLTPATFASMWIGFRLGASLDRSIRSR